MALRAVSRRDALCASALRGPTNAEACRLHPMMRQEAGWPTGHMPRSSRCLPIRACRARPSARWPSDGDKAFRAQTWRWGERRFSRRDALCASAWHGQTCAQEFRFHGTAGRGRVAHGDMPGWSQYLSRGRAESAPPRRGPSQLGWPAGKTQRQRERRFSRRDALCASALRGPTNAGAFHLHPMMRPEACGLPGTCLGQADASLAGVRSPPLGGGLAEHKWPYGKNSEMTRKVVFSEGRTLCVRVARPHKCQGIPFLPLDDAGGRWPTGHMSRSTPRLPCGRAEPAPPQGLAQHEWPCGANPEMARGEVFSEGRGLRVRIAKPYGSRGIT
jgi:hypothetical protein